MADLPGRVSDRGRARQEVRVASTRRPREQRTPRIRKENSSTEGRVLSILDEFSFRGWAPEFKLSPVPRDFSISGKEDLLLVESGWRPNFNEWAGCIYGEPSPDLVRLARLSRALQIPRVFRAKEDPPHYEDFLQSARLFDWVFTTDAECVDRYKRDLGHDQVKALPFAAQPKVHNPVNSGSRKSAVCFAGSWYSQYPQRCKDLEILLQGAARSGSLDVFDRHLAEKNPRYTFPPALRKYVRGSLSYAEMVKSYKGYKAFLNVNTVTSSPTMMARRVFELLASRTPVITNPTRAVDEMLGDVVLTAGSRAEASQHVQKVLGDEEWRDRFAQKGYRKVMREHAYRDRADVIREVLGLRVRERWPKATVAVVTNRPELLQGALDAFQRQTYPNKELVVVLNNDAFDLQTVSEQVAARFPGAKVLQVPEQRPLGRCLNVAVSASTGRYWAKFDDDDFYAADYLWDQCLKFRYTQAGIVGKKSHFVYLEESGETVLRDVGQEHQYVNWVSGATLVVRREVLARIKFRELSRGSDTAFLDDCRAAGVKVYSGDRYNFLMTRRLDRGTHTWTVGPTHFTSNGSVVYKGKDVSRVIA